MRLSGKNREKHGLEFRCTEPEGLVKSLAIEAQRLQIPGRLTALARSFQRLWPRGPSRSERVHRGKQSPRRRPHRVHQIYARIFQARFSPEKRLCHLESPYQRQQRQPELRALAALFPLPDVLRKKMATQAAGKGEVR